MDYDFMIIYKIITLFLLETIIPFARFLMRSRLRSCALISAALLLSGASAAPAQTLPAPSAVVEKWSRDLPDTTPPILSVDQQLIMCEGTQLRCLNLETGGTIWEVASPIGKAWPSSVLGGNLILISETFQVASIEVGTGKLNWKIQLDDLAKGAVGFGSVTTVSSPVTRPVMGGGLILIGTHGMKFLVGRTGKCYALDAATGKRVWAFETEDGVENPPLIDGERVYIGGVAAAYALDLKQGSQIWKAETRSDSQFTFTLQDGMLLVSSGHYGSPGGSFSGTAYGIDAKSGQRRWKYDIGGPSIMKVEAGKAVGLEWGMMGGTRLTCIDLATGAKAWELKEKSSAWPLVKEGKVIFQTRDNKVHVLDQMTGAPIGVFTAPGEFEMGWLYPWSRFLDPFIYVGKAAVASWDKAQKQTIIQPIDLGKGAPLDAIRVQGRLLCRPLQVGDRMICTVEKPGHLVTLKVF